MPCYHPLQGYRARFRNPNGKRPIVFNIKDGYKDMPVTLPCGQCIGCRLEKSRQWAIRCVHEASLYEDNIFLTLTYDEDNLPFGGTLVKKDFQDFIKRLRSRFSNQKIKYFHCGEYGEQFGRPHYHAIIFNLGFQDKELYKKTKTGTLYTAPVLDSLWPFGLATFGAVTFESCAYTARYVLKKVTGENAEKHYQKIDHETGEITQRLPEYVTMSLKPAIGKLFFNKYHTDIFPNDFVIMRGKKMKPPKYYQSLHELTDPDVINQIKLNRIKKSVPHKADATPRRLADREICKKSQIKQLKRTLE